VKTQRGFPVAPQRKSNWRDDRKPRHDIPVLDGTGFAWNFPVYKRSKTPKPGRFKTGLRSTWKTAGFMKEVTGTMTPKQAYNRSKAKSERLRRILVRNARDKKRDWKETAGLSGRYIDAVLAQKRAEQEYLAHEWRLEMGSEFSPTSSVNH